jgi:hypothetical protein
MAGDRGGYPWLGAFLISSQQDNNITTSKFQTSELVFAKNRNPQPSIL